MHALEIAARNAEKQLGFPVPRQFEIEMHGLCRHSRMLSKEEAFEQIYLGPDLFYRVINVAVRRVGKHASTVFMGISGHAPCPLDQTWNQPPGSGPFKQVLSIEIELT